ncbi:MAG: hypothetical protein EPN97_01290 [Alphaproteobacteria bacterium]|nr:MAG: hypothetical protein EPN97_01290 [Alphaproteobacteria bacterium]
MLEEKFNDNRPLLDQVAAELTSDYESSGASKEVQGVALIGFVSDDDLTATRARVSVFSRQTSPWGDSDDTRKIFELTADEVRQLAATAPKYSFSFAKIADEFTEQEARERVVRAQRAEQWNKASQPPQQPVTVLRPLRLKPRP